ncbi:MAG TPA: HAD family phosphatase [Candidatus Avidehalobacter gallistercoris]|uniref:HAD family phosphatase n=1 Tax=Candidatus Avidehalobacter gallistercoris TaxID=2840694 RepID=A0A9D1HLU7_9FIRM|nr:HAD family phosphatase [Candidatus Avidehalobacter gallistercoris]
MVNSWPDLRQIDAVIFDMDGTLVDSMPYWRILPENWFRERHLPVPEDLDVQLGMVDLWQASELLAERYSSSSETAEQVYAVLGETMTRHYAEDIPLMPYALEFLQQLAAAHIPACIATMTDRPQVETVLETHNIGGFFQFVLTTPEVGQGKDQPEIFLEAARRFGTKPGRTLVFEDSRTALVTALNAGFPAVCMRNAACDYTELDRLKAGLNAKLWYLDDFSPLLHIAKN